MASPALNFITFNQDHSCLAVGKSIAGFYRPPTAFHANSAPPRDRYLERIPHLPHRSIFANLQQRRWQHRNHRDALLDLPCRLGPVPAPPSNTKHKGKPATTNSTSSQYIANHYLANRERPSYASLRFPLPSWLCVSTESDSPSYLKKKSTSTTSPT